MATITGSGRWTKIISGVLSGGKDDETYASVRAETTRYNNVSYYGVALSSVQWLNLAAIEKLTVGGYDAYSGDVIMYTQFDDPYPILFWSSEDYDIHNVQTDYVTLRFRHGLLISGVE